MKALVMRLVLGAAAVVAAVTWWAPQGSATADAESSQLVPQEVRRPLDHADAPDATESSTPPTPLPPLGADGGLSSDELFSHLSDPANSDLPPALFTELSELGVDVVRADATGVGRERWPEYWRSPTGRAAPCCTGVVVHAAGAAAHPSGDGTVHVTVLWTDVATPHQDAAESLLTSFVRLRRTATGWQPLR